MSQWCWCLEKNNWVDSERTLRVRGAIIISHHSPVSHFVSPFRWQRDGVIASLTIYRFVRIYARVAWSVWSGLLAGGEPWFPHSAVLFLTSLAWRFCDWCFAPFCHLFSRHTNPFDNAKQLSLATVLSGPMSLQCFWCFACGFICFVFCLVLFAFLAFCWVLSCSFGIVTAYWTVYWSYFSTAFAAQQDGWISMH